MNLLAQSAFLKALGWALLHSLWQMGVLWLLYLLLTADGKRFQSRQRYNLALVFVSLGSVAFLITLAQEFYTFSRPDVIYHSFDETIASGSAIPFLSQMALWLEPALPFLSAAYLSIIALLFIRFFRQYYFSRQLINSGLQKIDIEYRLFVEQMVQRLNISKKIRIGLSDIINTPLTVGFWKPVILLPVAVTCHLSIQQTEAIILHELNHIKQNDYLVNLLIATLDILLFFNPFSRLLTSILVKERENSCDDLVLQFRYPATDYARALLLLEQQRLQATPVLAISATGTHKKILLNRVERMLHGKTNTRSANSKMVAFFFAALLIAFTGLYNPARVIHEQLPDRFAASRTALSTNSEILPVFTVTPSVTEQSDKTPAITIEFDNQLLTVKQEFAAPENDEEEALADQDVDEEKDAISLVNFASNVNTTAPAPVMGVGFAAQAEQPREFSIQENGAVLAPAASSMYFELQPFVPSNSFSYQYIEDTAFPKKYIPTPSDLKAREDLEKALKAIEEIDWEKLGKDLGGKAKLDVARLQSEIKKALTEVDWKKIEEELKSGLRQAGQDLKLRQAYLDRLTKFQREKAQQLERSHQKQQTIIMDRLLQNEELKKCEEEKKKGEGKVRKIVVI